MNSTNPNSTLTSSTSTQHLRLALQALPYAPDEGSSSSSPQKKKGIKKDKEKLKRDNEEGMSSTLSRQSGSLILRLILVCVAEASLAGEDDAIIVGYVETVFVRIVPERSVVQARVYTHRDLSP
jgi:hypothetical protein